MARASLLRWGLALAAFAVLAAACGGGGGDDDDDTGTGGRPNTGGSASSSGGTTAATTGGGQGGMAGANSCSATDRLFVTWQRVSGQPASGARALHAVAQTTDAVLLFGGERGGTALDDTWLFVGTAEGFEREEDAPPARAAHAMARAGDSLLLFGGLADTGLLGDSWTWSSRGWTDLCDSSDCGTTPSARSHHAMTFDSVVERVLLFGGTDGQALADTWTWSDDGGWRYVCGASTPDSLAAGGAGGAGGAPVDAAGAPGPPADACGPEPRADHALVFDDDAARALLFGGSNGIRDFNDVWGFEGTSWVPLDITGDGRPAARSGHTMVFDPTTRLVLVVGGTHDGLPVDDEVWGLDATSGQWLRAQQSAERPRPRSHAVLFADPKTEQLWFYGGSADPELQDLWSLTTRRLDGDARCACIVECQDVCAATLTTCSALCDSGIARPTPADCAASGDGGSAGSGEATGGFGGAAGGVSGAGGVPVTNPLSSSCQALLDCCSGLEGDERVACRSTAYSDDAESCEEAGPLCVAQQNNPDQASDCLQLASCCPELTGRLKSDCVALLSDTPPHCQEFLSGGFCSP